MHAGEFFCIGQQPLHLGLCAAVAELEVVQHGVILLGKALVGVLDGCQIRAHLVGVVGHIHHGHIGQVRSSIRILAYAGQQAGGNAVDLLHVGVGRQSRCPVCLRSVGHDGVSAGLE